MGFLFQLSTLLSLILLTVVCAITYSFEIVFGLAGTILMLPILAFVFPIKTLVIYSILPQTAVATIALYRSPQTVDLRFLGCVLVFAALGGLAGIYLFYTIPGQIFQILLASIITLAGISLIATPAKFHPNPFIVRLLDGLAGLSHTLFGISGPIMGARFLSTLKDKTVIRNYLLAFFLSLNLVRLSGYLANNTITLEIWRMMYISAPFLVVTFWCTNYLHFQVSEKVFRQVVSWIILGGGITLFFR